MDFFLGCFNAIAKVTDKDAKVSGIMKKYFRKWQTVLPKWNAGQKKLNGKRIN